MAEVRLQIPSKSLANFQLKLAEGTKATDIARDAMTLYNWAVNEKAKGRVILTAKQDGSDFVKLAMPSLEGIDHTA